MLCAGDDLASLRSSVPRLLGWLGGVGGGEELEKGRRCESERLLEYSLVEGLDMSLEVAWGS